LVEARLTGTFGSEAFFFGQDFTFAPVCVEGSCDVVGTSEDAEVRFHHDAAVYRGTERHKVECTGGPKLVQPLRITYTLRVTDAEYIGGVWRATELEVVSVTRAPEVRDSSGVYVCEGTNVREEAMAVLK
jgi:hypothetical protein